jgi:hypothetical protein
LIRNESGWKPDAQHPQISGRSERAVGLGGVLQSTARQPGYGMKPNEAALTKPEENLRFALDYADARIRAAGGDVRKGLMGYGGGGSYPADGIMQRAGMQPASAPNTQVADNRVSPATINLGVTAPAPTPAPAAAAAPQQAGPVSRSVMEFVFGRKDPSTIGPEAVRRYAAATGMSEDDVRAAQKPLPFAQMPAGTRMDFDPVNRQAIANTLKFRDGAAQMRFLRGEQTREGDIIGYDEEQAGKLKLLEAEAAARRAGRNPTQVPAATYQQISEAVNQSIGNDKTKPLFYAPGPSGVLTMQFRDPSKQAHWNLEINRAQQLAQDRYRTSLEAGRPISTAEAARVGIDYLQRALNGGRRYNSPQEVQEAIRRGDLRVGDTFMNEKGEPLVAR